MKLPPRTPSWMPLDYSLWNEVESRVATKPQKINDYANPRAAGESGGPGYVSTGPGPGAALENAP